MTRSSAVAVAARRASAIGARLALGAAGLALVACDQDPARSVKILSRPAPPPQQRRAPPRGAQPPAPEKEPARAAADSASRARADGPRGTLAGAGTGPSGKEPGLRAGAAAPQAASGEPGAPPSGASGAAPGETPAQRTTTDTQPGSASESRDSAAKAGAQVAAAGQTGARAERSGGSAAAPSAPDVPAGGVPVAQPEIPDWQWRPDLCPPPPEPPGGPGTFEARGACEFRQEGAVGCSSLEDDFLLDTQRPAARGATLILYINVEHYHGPGRYEDGQMLLTVQDAAGVFRWRSDTAAITVGENEKFADLESTPLESLPPMDESFVTVSGRLVCRPPAGGK